MPLFGDWARYMGLSQRVLVLFDIPLAVEVYDFPCGDTDSDQIDNLIKFFNHKDSCFRGDDNYERLRAAFFRKGKGDKSLTSLGCRLFSFPIFSDTVPSHNELSLLDVHQTRDINGILQTIGMENLRCRDIMFLRETWLRTYENVVRSLYRQPPGLRSDGAMLTACCLMRNLCFILRWGAVLKKVNPNNMENYVLWSDLEPRSILKKGFWKWNKIELVLYSGPCKNRIQEHSR